MSALLHDVRYTLRTLRRDVGFATFAVAIAGLGIGATTTVFSVVNTVLVRPLPFVEPQRLVWIVNHQTAGLSGQTTQVGHMLDLRERTRTLAAVAGYMAFYGVGDTMLTGRGEPERLNAVPVSENFFPVLGVRPEIGRTFTAEEAKISDSGRHAPSPCASTPAAGTRRARNGRRTSTRCCASCAAFPASRR